MDNTTNENFQGSRMNDKTGREKIMDLPGPGHGEESTTAPGNLREVSYVMLFIAAVFVINAMETGSYRTPWPVAIAISVLGFGLFGYSWHLQSRSKK